MRIIYEIMLNLSTPKKFFSFRPNPLHIEMP